MIGLSRIFLYLLGSLEIYLFICRKKVQFMHKEEIISSIRKVSQSVMPIGAKVILFGSQARNEAHEESDWDILILFNKNERVNNDDFDKMAYPFVELGWEMGASINPIIYSYTDWEKRQFTSFYHNVKEDGIVLWH